MSGEDEKIKELFENSYPFLDYSVFTSKSIRNNLLGYFLLESIDPRIVVQVLKKDAGVSGIGKLVLGDELYFHTGKKPFFTPDEKEWKDSLKDDHYKNKRPIGRAYIKSDMKKMVRVVGMELLQQWSTTNFEVPVKYFPSLKQKSKRPLQADPAHAANCYLDVLEDENLFFKVGSAKNTHDLKMILASKYFIERIKDEPLREKAYNSFFSQKVMDRAFVDAVISWNQDRMLYHIRR